MRRDFAFNPNKKSKISGTIVLLDMCVCAFVCECVSSSPLILVKYLKFILLVVVAAVVVASCCSSSDSTKNMKYCYMLSVTNIHWTLLLPFAAVSRMSLLILTRIHLRLQTEEGEPKNV